MCGISVIINKHNYPVDKGLIKSMNDRIRHRGPNGEGYGFRNNFAMGHRRLSIVDLSAAGEQPMIRNDEMMVFNGMIYNYVELKKELAEAGFGFQSNTDTEVLLAACQQWGVNAFEKLNGMWAFAWYKANTNEIIICRDRFGIKPLYFTEFEGIFTAASEIKQFLDLPGFKRILNYSAAIDYLTDGWLNHSEQTFFNGVTELRPGCYLIYNLSTHKYSIHQWYNINEASKPVVASKPEVIKKIKDIFEDALHIRMRGDVKIGSCLSGGLDSSSIVSTLHHLNLPNKNFSTVTSCYREKRYDEQDYSDVITNQTNFESIKVFPELDDIFEKDELGKMVYHFDQPFSTLSHYSEYKVFETANKYGFKVMLDGQGADEYFCGYEEFYTTYLKCLLKKFKIISLLKSIALRSRTNGESFLNTLKIQIKSAYFFPLIATIKKMIGQTSIPWLNDTFYELVKRQKKSFTRNNIREYSLQQMQYSSLPYQLHSQDRTAMLFSIESRTPFLDHRLVEFVIGLPDSIKISNRFSKQILRDAMDVLPEKVKWRTKKMGFVAPDELWVRDNYKKIRTELFDAVVNTKIFSIEVLNRFDKFIAGKLQYEPVYLRAIILNRFIDVFKMQLSITDIEESKLMLKKHETVYKRA